MSSAGNNLTGQPVCHLLFSVLIITTKAVHSKFTYSKFINFHEDIIFAKFRENKTLIKMVKSLCHLLMLVNHALVTNFSLAYMSFKAIRESKGCDNFQILQ